LSDDEVRAAQAVYSMEECFSSSADGSSWHETDMPIALRYVRFQGQSGKHVLAWSFSGFDP